MRGRTKASCIAATVSLIPAVVCAIAFAQPTGRISRASTPRGNFYNACPSGHRLEFVVGSLTLYVDPHWLALESEIPLWQRFRAGCPSRPIAITSLYFHHAILDLANMPAGLGEPFFFLAIRNEASLARNRIAKLELQNAPPLKQTAQPYIEDVTGFAFRAVLHPPPSVRVYRLVYPGTDNEPPTSIEVSCGGEPSRPNAPGPGRTCFTPIAYSYLGSLSVDYKFRQDGLPIGKAEREPLTSAMCEAEGVLVFDTRIRGWLDSLTKKP
jgi:hypothetical protein